MHHVPATLPDTERTQAFAADVPSVQAHGAVMVIDPETLVVPYVSANIGDVLGIEPDRWFQGALTDILHGKTMHDLQNLLSARAPNGQEIERGPITIEGQDFWLCICHLEGLILLQFEALNGHDLKKGQSLDDLSFLVSAASKAESVEDLQMLSARMLRAITGYDRVLICGTGDKGELVPVASSASSGAPPVGADGTETEPFHHQTMRMSLVPNIYSANIPLMKRAPDLPDPDLSCSHMHSPDHRMRQTMQKAGFSAFWTQPIPSGDETCGLIIMQHEIPRRPPPHLRNVIALYAQYFETRLRLLEALAR